MQDTKNITDKTTYFKSKAQHNSKNRGNIIINLSTNPKQPQDAKQDPSSPSPSLAGSFLGLHK